MMKGIVVEIENKDAVILTNDGLFKKVKNTNYEIGQKIMIKESRKTGSKLIMGAASMVAAAAICTIGAFAYYTPTDYVSLDVNPSVEYSINRFDRILDVKAVNDDGAELLIGLNLKYKTIEAAVKETIDKLMIDGYLVDDPNGGVVITTSNDELEKAEQLAAELKKGIQTYLSRKGVAAEVDAEAVEMERVLEARELGVTPGKLNLVDQLQESTDGEINKAMWLTMPVKEINKAIKENRKQEKELRRNEFDGEDRLKLKDFVTDGGLEWTKQASKDQDQESEITDQEQESEITDQEQNGKNAKETNKQGIEQIENEAENDPDDKSKDNNRQDNEKQKDNGRPKDKEKWKDDDYWKD